MISNDQLEGTNQKQSVLVGADPGGAVGGAGVRCVFGYVLTIGALGERLLACVNAVFALLTVLGIVTDPTTAGVGDSNRALGYDAPYREEKTGE